MRSSCSEPLAEHTCTEGTWVDFDNLSGVRAKFIPVLYTRRLRATLLVHKIQRRSLSAYLLACSLAVALAVSTVPPPPMPTMDAAPIRLAISRASSIPSTVGYMPRLVNIAQLMPTCETAATSDASVVKPFLPISIRMTEESRLLPQRYSRL